jgi:Uma2 family endonuclease
LVGYQQASKTAEKKVGWVKESSTPTHHIRSDDVYLEFYMATDLNIETKAATIALGPSTSRPPSFHGQAVRLSGISWNEYIALREKPENGGVRMTFADGDLEIMTLSSFHELISAIIDHFILEWRVANEIPVVPSGSMTLKKELFQRGLEPDQSYYIKRQDSSQKLDSAEFATPSLPDLAIEVDHSSSSIPKLPIYAELGIPEIWCWRDETLRVLVLDKGKYMETSESIAFPGFPFEQLKHGLKQRFEVDETKLIKEFRDWLAINKQIGRIDSA